MFPANNKLTLWEVEVEDYDYNSAYYNRIVVGIFPFTGRITAAKEYFSYMAEKHNCILRSCVLSNGIKEIKEV